FAGEAGASFGNVPMMIGDSFGGGSSKVIVQPAPFFVQDPSQSVNFLPGYRVVNFGTSGSGSSGFGQAVAPFSRCDAIFPVSQYFSTVFSPPEAFTSTAPVSGQSITAGTPIVQPSNPTVAPSTPQPSTAFNLNQGGSRYQAAAMSQILADQPGLA